MRLANGFQRQRGAAQAISRDLVPIAYEVVGAGRPLLLLHGFTESRACWFEAGYVDAFAQHGRQLILMDCRGHGASGKLHEPSAYSGRKCAEDVMAVLDDAGIGSADVMGHSMGGAIALAAAMHIPERIGGLVVNGAHPFAQDLSPLRAAVAESFEPWLAWVQRLAPGRLSPETRRRILANDIRALQACVAHDRPDRSSALTQLRSPTLAIAGTLDPICDAVRRFAELAGGEFLPLEDRNHLTAFFSVEDVVPAVVAFLDATGSRPG